MFQPLPELTVRTIQALNKAEDPLGMAQKRLFAEEMAQMREQRIARWYQEGGSYYLNWVKAHYRRWTGEALRWEEPYLEEAYLLRGNPWIEKLMEEKGAQVGMSESMIALAAFVVSEIRVSCAYGFEQERKMRDIVGPRLQPAFSFIEPVQALIQRYKDSVQREDTDSRDRKITVGGVPLTFFYAKVAAKNTQERQVSSSLSSFEAYVVELDEVESCPADAINIAEERQGACTMPTKPFRAGSTPGAEGGVVDGRVKNSAYCFQWRVCCPHCSTIQFLHPFGNLLKPVAVTQDDGSIEDQFIDVTGRPMDWFSHSTDKKLADLDSPEERDLKVSTAYIGCLECGKELDWEARSQGCLADNPHRVQQAVKVAPEKLGLTARDFDQWLVKSQEPVHEWVAMRLPRLASTMFDTVERIRKLTTTKNPADAIQQGLGIPISVGMGKIALSRLLKCVGLPLPIWCQNREPDLRVAGVDQGTAAHWLIVTEWYFPPDETDKEQRWLKAHVRVTHHGTIAGFEELEAIMEKENLDLVGADHEPEVNAASKLARRHSPRKVKKGKVYLFDQVQLRWGEEWQESKRESQKQKYMVYALQRTWGLDAVRDRVNRALLHLPANLTYDPKDPENLLYHFMTSERTTDGRWSEAQGEPDHLFHAANFVEAAVHVSLFGKRGGLAVSLPPVASDSIQHEYPADL